MASDASNEKDSPDVKYPERYICSAITWLRTGLSNTKSLNNGSSYSGFDINSLYIDFPYLEM